MKEIIAAGFNPARQKVLKFETLVSGKVNRASSLEEFASGKGINFCRAARCHGKVSPRLIQFSGGANGTYIDEELQREGISFYSVRTEAATRCCDTCIDLAAGRVTELIEPSYPANEAEVAEYIDVFSGAVKTASAAALCGTLPTGTDKGLYGKLARITAEAGIPLLVDAWRDVDDIFSSGAQIVLKINKDELAVLTGCADVKEAFSVLRNRWGIKLAAITDGPGRAFAFDGEKTACYTLPVLEKVINPIGCGDTASAVLLSELVSGSDLFAAFRHALGAASANCLSDLCGSFLRSDSERLSAGIICETE